MLVYSSGMRFFRNFPDLRGHSHGNPRSGLIFMGGGGVLEKHYCSYMLMIISH